jgi:hypothetical protein
LAPLSGSTTFAGSTAPTMAAAVSTRFCAAVSTAQLRSSSAQPPGISKLPAALTGGQFQLMNCGEPKSPSAFTQPPSSTCTTSPAGTGCCAR